MQNIINDLNKAIDYLSLNLTGRYDLLTEQQKDKVKISVKRYHEHLDIAIQQAYFFNKISCDDINEYIRVNKWYK